MPDFVYPGALTTSDTCYIEREADREIAQALQFGRFVHLAEPRQQGKTSLINRLADRPELKGRCILQVRANAFRGTATPDEWYSLIGGEILRKLAGAEAFPDGNLPPVPRHGNEWYRFLDELALETRRDLVITIDEIDIVQFEGSDQFYSVIKDIRELNRSRLAFVLSGCFHPSSLIQDERCSPFNAANRVELADFTLEQVRRLVGYCKSWQPPQLDLLAERIHHWTDGHPAISQYICTRLPENAVADDVDAAVDYFIRHDVNNLPRINAVLKHPELRTEFANILASHREFLHEFDHETPDSRLRLAGLIKRGPGEKLVVRNKIYKDVFKPADTRTQVFISYRRENGTFGFQLNGKLAGKGVRTFFDKDSLEPGDAFPERILEAIRTARCFVLVLSKGDLDRCKEDGDFLYREIKHALDLTVRPKIIPVLVQPCKPPRREDLPEGIRELCDFQAIECSYEGFDQVAEQIVKRCCERPS